MTILKGYYLGQVRVIIWAKFDKKGAETPIFIVFLQTVLKKTNLAQIITLQMAKLGPENNSTAYIYIYICCKVKKWSKIWGFKVKKWSKLKAKKWSKLFHCFPHFYSVLGHF